MPSNPPIFYTTDEVAQILKIPVRLVRKLIREGHLNAVKVGREYRVTSDHLRQFVKEKSRK
jgi:excisionase family DNA binding protein